MIIAIWESPRASKMFESLWCTRVISETRTNNAQVPSVRVLVSGKRCVVWRDLWLGGAGRWATYAGTVQLYRAQYSDMLVLRSGDHDNSDGIPAVSPSHRAETS